MNMHNDNKRFDKIRPYFLLAAFLIAIPSILSFYSGQTGRILVATEDTENDHNFSKTVVYVLKHGFWGAQGIVINKPIKNDGLKNIKTLPKNSSLFKGGPMAFPSLKTIARNKPKTASHWRAQPLTIIDYDEFVRTNNNMATKNDNLNIYLGYAGWAMGQLESEIDRGIWKVIKCNEINLTNIPAAELWSRLNNNDKKLICK